MHLTMARAVTADVRFLKLSRAVVALFCRGPRGSRSGPTFKSGPAAPSCTTLLHVLLPRTASAAHINGTIATMTYEMSREHPSGRRIMMGML
jgi:hypothetical protein